MINLELFPCSGGFAEGFRRAGEAPPVCSSSGCLNVAQWECFWPGQTCDKCHACKAKLSTVAKALGFDLQARALNIPVGDDDTSIRGSLLEYD